MHKLGLDVKISDKARKILSYFFTIINLMAAFEAKMVIIWGIQLEMKHFELADVLKNGFSFKALPAFMIIMGILSGSINSFASYVFYRCRIESYRSRKFIVPTLANTSLELNIKLLFII